MFLSPFKMRVRKAQGSPIFSAAFRAFLPVFAQHELHHLVVMEDAAGGVRRAAQLVLGALHC